MKRRSQEIILPLCNNMTKFNFDSYDFSRSLVLSWPTWTWKTYKAEELLDKFGLSIEEGKRSKFDYASISDWKFKQLVKSNQLCLRKPDERGMSLSSFPLEVMIRCKLLLYDDIWVSDASDAYIRDLTFVLDERTKKWLITIFTTNLSKEELEKKLNERIVSRMLYNADIVSFTWEDLRSKTIRVFAS